MQPLELCFSSSGGGVMVCEFASNVSSVIWRADFNPLASLVASHFGSNLSACRIFGLFAFDNEQFQFGPPRLPRDRVQVPSRLLRVEILAVDPTNRDDEKQDGQCCEKPSQMSSPMEELER